MVAILHRHYAARRYAASDLELHRWDHLPRTGDGAVRRWSRAASDMSEWGRRERGEFSLLCTSLPCAGRFRRGDGGAWDARGAFHLAVADGTADRPDCSP